MGKEYVLSPEEIIYCEGENEWHKFDKNRISYIALEHGWLDLLEWAKYNGHKDENGGLLCGVAAKYGRLDMLEWITQNDNYRDTKLDGWTCYMAASSGHLDVLKWLVETKDCKLDDPNICSSATAGNHLEVLKWLHEQNCEWSENTCFNATENEHQEIINWLNDNDCPCKGKYH